MKTLETTKAKVAKAITSASTPIAEKRFILFNPSQEDADELSQAALRQKITVSDFCRNAVEMAATEKGTTSQVTFIAPVPGGDKWPFSVDLETWFKARNKAEIQGLSVDQWAYLIIRKAIITTKAPATKKATKPSVAVENFTVSESWVKVTATIREDHFPKFRPEGDPDRAISFMVSAYADSLSIYTRAAKESGVRSVGLYDISIDAGKWGYNRLGTLSLKNSTEITCRMKESQWLKFVEDCEFIGHPPEAVIRGAFGSRSMGLGRPGSRENAQKGGEG